MKIPKFLKSNTLIAILILLNLIVGGTILFRQFARNRHVQTKSEWYIEQNANFDAKNGIMSREQYYRINDITRAVEHNGGRITDADLSYCVSIFRKPTTRENFRNRGREDMEVGMLIQHTVTDPTPAQCDQLYSEFCRDTANPKDFDKNCGSFVTVAAILARAHDQRITTALMALRNNRYPTIRQDVATMLRELGHYEQTGGKS